MLKNVTISIILCFLLSAFAFAEKENKLLILGVTNYKDGNYLGTIQAMEEVVDDDPGCTMAYYYMAISYVRLGEMTKARDFYDKVIILSPGTQLARYADIGKNLTFPMNEKNQKPAAKNNSPEKFYSKNVEKGLEERNLKFLIEKINRHKTIDPSEYDKFKDYTPNKSDKGMPDGEELANAIKTLMRAGINPFANYSNPAMNTAMNPAMNPEMMQAGMYSSFFGGMGGQNTGNSMNMLPLLMMMQGQNNGNGTNKVDPQYIQSMLTNMMMPDMMNFSEKKDY